MADHLATCDFRIVPCRYVARGCKAQVCAKDRLHHVRTCNFRPTKEELARMSVEAFQSIQNKQPSKEAESSQASGKRTVAELASSWRKKKDAAKMQASGEALAVQ
ncbi:cel3 [Symbiodinium microadriaticum]|nr:cel3 [Symbiodinium microadriaticum]